jgi:hypothetical protein
MKFFNLVLASALVLGTAAAAFAQAPAPAGGGRGGAMRAACGTDIQTLCAGKQGPEIRQCIMDNQSKLSDGCKAALANAPGRGPAPAGQ